MTVARSFNLTQTHSARDSDIGMTLVILFNPTQTPEKKTKKYKKKKYKTTNTQKQKEKTKIYNKKHKKYNRNTTRPR
jgi:hypothetical protein